jgi:hypothetical protein
LHFVAPISLTGVSVLEYSFFMKKIGNIEIKYFLIKPVTVGELSRTIQEVFG